MTILLRTRRPLALIAVVGATMAALSLSPASSAFADTTTISTALCSDTLQQGASGPCVSELQTRLNELGSDLSVDGAFGPATDDEVLAFQGRSQIGFDGVVGPATQAALNSPTVDLNRADTGTIGAYIDSVFGGDAPTARRIATCESSLRETAINRNTDGSVDVGVFQMNTIHANGDLTGFVHSALYYQSNVDLAHALFVSAGSFQPWYSSEACWG